MSTLNARLLLSLALAAAAHAATTLDRIQSTRSLACGINIEQPEYSTQDAHGNLAAFDLDLCKAVAAAVNARLTVLPFRDEQDALNALRAGQIALLATASANYSNSTADLGFSRPVFYDYQGFLVNKSMAIRTPRDLAGKKICFLGSTETQFQLEAYMRREKIDWLPFPFQEEGEMEAAFITRNCAAVAANVSQLACERIAFKSLAAAFEILPDIVAKDPLALAYRLDDPHWAAIVNWTVEALIQAEESGLTQATADALKPTLTPAPTLDLAAQRLLGIQPGYGHALQLDDAWAVRVLQAVGNYGEIFDRDLGTSSPIHLPRGPNNLWTNGGLLYALPIR